MMHVITDVIIGVAGGLLTIALCVVAIVILRTLYVARRKRLHHQHAQGASDHAVTRFQLSYFMIK